MRILIAEDEKSLNRIIAKQLKSAGYSVDCCFDGEEAYDMISMTDYDAAVFDVMMPKIDGFSLLKKIRNDGNALPILFLTARDSIEDRVEGLDIGADDYLVKPFAFEELLARVRVLIRKNSVSKSSIICVGDLTVDISSRTVTKGGNILSLSAKEYELLQYLAVNKGIVLSREKIIEIVKEAGKIILSAHNQETTITIKEGKKNFVTKYDVAVQDFLFKELAKEFPEAEFVGEEGDNNLESNSLRFIIDPIDGTTNFMQDYRCSCISVALCKENSTILGVVYNPYTNEVFSAEKDNGAFLNGEKIKVSDRPLSDGLALFGTSPYHPENTDETFALLRKVFDFSRDIRRSGSAAYDICTIACGRCEVFFEKSLQPWDIAAGALILKEAGGIALTYESKEINFSAPNDVVFANPKAYEEFVTLL